MNLFYKIHLQAFNVISIVLYHSSPTFGQVLYFCLDAFVVDASDYSAHLIRHLLNASEAFRTEWFLQFREQVKVSFPPTSDARSWGINNNKENLLHLIRLTAFDKIQSNFRHVPVFSCGPCNY
jgi:hypothetical protein